MSDVPPPQTDSGLSGLEGFGSVIGIAGMVASAIGSFYEAKSRQYVAESEALSMDFRRSMADINARAAEMDARAILEAGRHERVLSGLRYGAVRGAQEAGLAARGVEGGLGSAAEILATTAFARDADAYAIDVGAARGAAAARRQATDFRTTSLLSGMSAANLRLFGRSISPFSAGATSLIRGGGQVASAFGRSSARRGFVEE